MFWWLEPLAVFGKHYLSKFRKPLIYTLCAGAIFGAGMLTGSAMTNAHHAKVETRTAQEAVTNVINEANANTEQVRVEYREDLSRVRKLEADRDRLRAENVSLQERIAFYVPQGSGPDGGYLSNGAVGLLNDASQGVAAGTHHAAGPSTQADTASSDVSWLDLSRHTVRISGLYNDARLQCNALIEWVDRNVVQTPAQ